MAAEARAPRRATRGERRRYAEEREYFLSRAQNYVNMFDPAIGFFQGRDAPGAGSRRPADYDPRVWGHEHDYTETDGWNFAFHAPHDGQGLANLYGGRDGLAQQARHVLQHAGDRQVPRLLRRHDPRDDRGARRPHGPVGLHQPGLAPHPVHVRLRRAAAKTQAKVREALRRLYLGSEIGQGYAGDEDNGEMSAWYLFSALGFYPLQVGQRELRDRLAAVQARRRSTSRTARDLVVKRAQQQRAQRLRPGPQAQRAALRPRLPAPLATSRAAGRSSSTWARSRRWGTGTDAAPPSITKGDEPAAAAARHDRRRRRDARRRAAGDAAALFDDDSSTVASLTGRSVAAVPLHGQPAGQLLHADLGHRRRRRPERLGREGLQRRRALEGARRAQRRDVPLALADAAVQARAPGQLRLLPDRGHRAAAATLGEVELLNPGKADTSPLVTDVDRVVGVGGRDGAGDGDGDQLRRRRGERDASRRPRQRLDGRARERARSGRSPTASRRRSSSRSPCRRARRRAPTRCG